MKISVTDMHTAGEPVRIVTDGYPILRGRTILEKRRDAKDNHDELRRALMLEPRGHAGMYGVIPVDPSTEEAQLAALFMHNAGYSTMCGHATIAIGQWAVESGRVEAVEPETRFSLELPCGIVSVRVKVKDSQVVSTSFDSVEAYLTHRDFCVQTGAGKIVVDIAYGGAFYAILPSSKLKLDFFDTPLDQLIEAATEITDAARSILNFDGWGDLGFLYGTILTDDAPPGSDTYNLCIFADGQIDRSPTGSGVTARMARDFARGVAKMGDSRMFFGPTGIGFRATIVQRVDSEHGRGAIVRVEGTSAVCGRAVFEMNSADPFKHGFSLPRSYAELLKNP